MQRGIWIIFNNTAGEIGRKFVPEVEGVVEVEKALYDAITQEHWTFAPGDSLQFVEGESEVV